MVFVMGSSSCFLQSSFSQSLLFPPSSSTSYSQHFFLCSPHGRNVKKTRLVAMASLHHGNFHPNESNYIQRRKILFLGIAVLPFLQLKARAAEVLVKEDRDIGMPGQDQNEKLREGEARPTPWLSLLNVVGILGAGVLGALYALAQKEKTATEATIQSLNNKLIEKEAAMDSLVKSSEKRLRDEQEASTKQINNLKGDILVLSTQLNAANSSIAGLRNQLKTVERLVEEHKVEIQNLQSELTKTREDKNMIEATLKEKLDSIKVLEETVRLLTVEVKDKEGDLRNLQSLLANKKLEYENLSSIYKQTKSDLAKANASIQRLNEDILKIQKELDSKNSYISDLNMRINALVAERDDITRRAESLEKDYNDLKTSFEKKAASDAELLVQREHKINQLDEKLGIALTEARNNQQLVSDLTHERDGLKERLAIETHVVNNLRTQLHISEEALKSSRGEASHLSEELAQSIRSCEELALDVSRIQAEFKEAQESFKKSLEKERSNSEILSNEIGSVKKVLQKTRDEFRAVSDELAAAIATRDSLKKELLDVYKKADKVANALEAEKSTVATLRKELEASLKQISSDKEMRQSLETDLEATTKALDEVNRNVVILSEELDMANSRASNIQAEKDMLFNSLTQQRNLSNEARENVEDAHNLIMKLGKEKESLEKKANKLDDELGSAKGEILRLRSQINSSSKRSEGNGVLEPKNKKSDGNDTVVGVKKAVNKKSEGNDSVLEVKKTVNKKYEGNDSVAGKKTFRKKK